MEKQRLIDANALKQELERRQSWQSEKTASRFKEGFDCGLEAALEDIVAAPTVPAVVLPCAVGDTVYLIARGYVEDVKVRTIFIGHPSYNRGEPNPSIEMIRTTNCDIEFQNFGRTLFFTREEAEAALRRAENG